MFNLYGSERLNEWKKFRDSLETSNSPYQDVAMMWSQAPFVNSYLDPKSPDTWPDPWHLVIDGKFDDLAISLGMLYTLKLTRRFMESKFEIHMSMLNEIEEKYILIVNDEHVLNWEFRHAEEIKNLPNLRTTLLWSKV